MLAPILAGQLFYFIGYTWTGVFIAIWNIFSVVCEYILLHGIYSQYPRLAHKITSPKHTKDTNERNDCEEASKLTNVCNEKQSNENDKLEDKTSTTRCGKMTPEAINACFIGWQTYFDHPVRYSISNPHVFVQHQNITIKTFEVSCNDISYISEMLDLDCPYCT